MKNNGIRTVLMPYGDLEGPAPGLSLVHFAQAIEALNRRAHAEYAAIVEELLRSDCLAPRRIEHTLDGLLDFCGNDEVLQLYRRLCRHYFAFDPAAAVYYVNAYREMYGSDDVAEVGE
jgi:hypothetical protein